MNQISTWRYFTWRLFNNKTESEKHLPTIWFLICHSLDDFCFLSLIMIFTWIIDLVYWSETLLSVTKRDSKPSKHDSKPHLQTTTQNFVLNEQKSRFSITSYWEKSKYTIHRKYMVKRSWYSCKSSAVEKFIRQEWMALPPPLSL